MYFVLAWCFVLASGFATNKTDTALKNQIEESLNKVDNYLANIQNKIHNNRRFLTHTVEYDYNWSYGNIKNDFKNNLEAMRHKNVDTKAVNEKTNDCPCATSNRNYNLRLSEDFIPNTTIIEAPVRLPTFPEHLKDLTATMSTHQPNIPLANITLENTPDSIPPFVPTIDEYDITTTKLTIDINNTPDILNPDWDPFEGMKTESLTTEDTLKSDVRTDTPTDPLIPPINPANTTSPLNPTGTTDIDHHKILSLIPTLTVTSPRSTRVYILTTEIVTSEPTPDFVQHYTPPTTPKHAFIEPFIVKLKEEMVKLKNGYFSMFLTKLMHMIATKPRSDVWSIVQVTERVLTVMHDEGKLVAFGEPFTETTMSLAQMISAAPSDVTKSQASLIHNFMSDRKKYMAPDAAAIVDYIDSLYTDHEGEDLFSLLHELEDFPHTNKRIYDIIKKGIDEIILAPFRRLAGTTRRQILIDSMNKAIKIRMSMTYTVERRSNDATASLNYTDINTKEETISVNTKVNKETNATTVKEVVAKYANATVKHKRKRTKDLNKVTKEVRDKGEANVIKVENITLTTLLTTVTTTIKTTTKKNVVTHKNKTRHAKKKLYNKAKKLIHLKISHPKIYEKYIKRHTHKPRKKKRKLTKDRRKKKQRNTKYIIFKYKGKHKKHKRHKYEIINNKHKYYHKTKISDSETDNEYTDSYNSEVSETEDSKSIKTNQKRFSIKTREHNLKIGKNNHKRNKNPKFRIATTNITKSEATTRKVTTEMVTNGRMSTKTIAVEKNEANSKESSIYDDEEVLRNNLDDAFIHGHRVFYVKPILRAVDKFHDTSVYTDEEIVLKSKIYKAIGLSEGKDKRNKVGDKIIVKQESFSDEENVLKENLDKALVF